MQFIIDPDTDEIKIEAINSGKAIVDYAIQSTIYLFQTELGESRHQENCRKLLGLIVRRKKEGRQTSWKDLLQSKLLPGGSKEYQIVVDHLIEAGQLTKHPSKTKKNDTFELRNEGDEDEDCSGDKYGEIDVFSGEPIRHSR